MLGLGCGARSYTAALHYSFDYAVGIPHVRAVLDEYLTRDAAAFARADRGFRLDGHEQRTRWLIKSLLRAPGLDAAAYRRRFGTAYLDDFPQLVQLHNRGWMTGNRLTAEGLAMSDLIGPWLMTDRVRRAMAGYDPR